MVAHREITWYPRLLIPDVDDFPNIFLNIISLTNVGDFFWREFDSARENINELGVEDTASGRVSGHIEFCHSDPLVNAYIVILTGFVKVFGVISTDNVDPIFFRLVNSGKIGSGVIQIGSVLQLFVLFYVFKHPIATDIVLVTTSNTEQPPVVAHYRPAELRDVIFEVN